MWFENRPTKFTRHLSVVVFFLFLFFFLFFLFKSWDQISQNLLKIRGGIMKIEATARYYFCHSYFFKEFAFIEFWIADHLHSWRTCPWMRPLYIVTKNISLFFYFINLCRNEQWNATFIFWNGIFQGSVLLALR